MSVHKKEEFKEYKDKVNELISRKFLVGEKGMVMIMTLKKGCIFSMHKHPEEQFTYIVKGKLKYEIAGKEAVILTDGDAVHLPSNVGHGGGEALEDTLVLDIFTPVRKELLP